MQITGAYWTTSTRIVLVSLSAAFIAAASPPVVSQTCTANAIVCENQQGGSPASVWDISGAGDATLQGFATAASVNKGETVHFKVATSAASYQVDIYRLGYYGGAGARLVAALGVVAGQNQPTCLTAAGTGLIDCGNWTESAAWSVPGTAVSGVYVARLTRADTGGASHIPFVVRDDAAQADVVVQTSDTTWQAYNTYGGNSLYVGGPGTNPGRAYKVSYNRPITTRGTSPEDFLFNAEYPLIRWLEANGYTVSYLAGVDTDRIGATELVRHRVFVSIGHDEYWSGPQRANVEAARNAGVHLAFLSGNEMFWKTRWEASIDGTGTPYRTLVSYKETHANAVIDPQDPPTWTGTWRDPRFSPPGDGGRPENAVTGTLFTVNCCTTTSTITVSSTYASQPFWRNTRVANLTAGQSTTLGSGMLGYEWDENVNNGSRPAGLTALSATTLSVTQKLQDYGSTYGAGTATHALTLYRHPSGALVFGAGTVQWSWGLDGTHDRGGSTPDLAVQQATVNLLADMTVQPGSLQPGLVPGTPSTDTTPPTSAITSPSSGASFARGTAVTIAGTASDTGGGTVSTVQVSTDGGSTWQSALGTTSWTYSWTPAAAGTVTIKSRATDNSGNIETPGAGITVTVTSGGCPCSIWGGLPTPARIATDDPNAVEVGVKFKADVSGSITGLMFYKGATNTGTHVADLWSNAGTLLATATFTNETASGWQQVNFTAPVAITANTTYVASYHTNTGNYGLDEPYFASAGFDSSPLHALSTAAGNGNGVYLYGASGFPTQTFNASNYWVDVVFTSGGTGDTTPPTVTMTAPAGGATVSGSAVTVSATASDNVGVAGVQFKLDGANLGTEVTTAPYTIAWNTTSAANGSHGLTATARDAAGNTATSTTVNVTVSNAGTTCPCSIWPQTATPGPMANDSASVELGVKFRSDSNGQITGIRFYKYASNSGTHTGHLWTTGGTQLATVTFTNETASGWQQALFSSPVAITANTTYLASYFAPAGSYAITEPGFTAGVDNAPLHALSDSTAPGNGVYAYGASSQFPTQTFQASNYWVDVVFMPSGTDTTPPTVALTAPVSGATVSGAAVTVSATASDNVGVAGVQFKLDSANLGAEVTTAPYTIAWNTTTASNGSHGLTAIARDGAGNTATATVVNVTVNNDTTPPTVTSTTPASGATGVAATTAVTATFSEALNPSTVSGSTFTLKDSGSAAVAATVAYSGTTATLTPTVSLAAGASYTATIVGGAAGVKDLVGNPLAANVTWTFTTAAASGCPCSIWPSSATPAGMASDPSAVELGVKFRADSNGQITGIRFYKYAPNTGTHIGNLWTTAGTLLGTVTFTNETASGWQQAVLTSPVAVTANTTYIASYFTPTGSYALTGPGFTTGVDNPPLHALADGTAPGNGVYAYGASSRFPSSTYQASNYWVDVVFTPSGGSDTTPPTVAMTAPANGATVGGAAVALSATASDNVGVVGVQFKVDGANLGAEVTTAPYAISWNTTTTANGAHGLTAVARDAAGNTTTSAAINVTVSNDTTPPTVSITAPAVGATLSGTAVTISATAADNVAVAGVQFKLDGASLGAEVTASPYTISWNSTTASNGTHSLTATARDSSGNLATSTAVSVTVSNAVSSALAIDAAVSVDRSSTSTTLATSAFSTHSTNELLVAFVSADDVSAGNTVTGLAGAGLSWQLVVRTNAQRGTAEVWRAFSAAALTNVTVTATLAQPAAASITVVTFTGADTTGTNGSGAIGATQSASAASGAPTDSVVTTRNGSWVFGVGTDWDGATARTLGSNQTLVHQYLATVGDTYWVQRTTNTTPTSGTTVTINDSAPTNHRYNLAICEILPSF